METAHDRALAGIRDLCGILHDGMRQDIADTPTERGEHWCTIGKPVIAYVQHTKDHLNVFLTCKEDEGAHLSALIGPGATELLSKRKKITSEWAKKTPFFLNITSPNDATAAIPILNWLARRPSRNPHPKITVMPSEDRTGDDHWEGNRAIIHVNRYERDPKARAACIKLFGTACSVCGLDFAKRYGEIGRGFIHVHHLNPLSSIGDTHQVNPKTDLRPVCPNCHEMLHKGPPYSIEELREIMSRFGTE